MPGIWHQAGCCCECHWHGCDELQTGPCVVGAPTGLCGANHPLVAGSYDVYSGEKNDPGTSQWEWFKADVPEHPEQGGWFVYFAAVCPGGAWAIRIWHTSGPGYPDFVWDPGVGDSGLDCAAGQITGSIDVPSVDANGNPCTVTVTFG